MVAGNSRSAAPTAEADAAVLPAPALSHGFEQNHVQDVYDAIAPHFAATRYAPWPRVDDFLSSLPTGALVADVGCGNGKYLLAASHIAKSTGHPLYAIGTDLCAPLVQIASQQPGVAERADVCVADARSQPFRDGVFDAALNIAVVHHLSTKERRIAAWAETARLLRPEKQTADASHVEPSQTSGSKELKVEQKRDDQAPGRALLYVWALERPQKPPEPRHGNRGRKMLSRRFESQDMMVPWHMRTRKAGASSDKVLGETEKVYMRYYHVYTEGELESELSCITGIRIVELFYDHQNWCAVIERTSVQVNVVQPG